MMPHSGCPRAGGRLAGTRRTRADHFLASVLCGHGFRTRPGRFRVVSAAGEIQAPNTLTHGVGACRMLPTSSFPMPRMLARRRPSRHLCPGGVYHGRCNPRGEKIPNSLRILACLPSTHADAVAGCAVGKGTAAIASSPARAVARTSLGPGLPGGAPLRRPSAGCRTPACRPGAACDCETGNGATSLADGPTPVPPLWREDRRPSDEPVPGASFQFKEENHHLTGRSIT